jgi:hypothetical protein
MPAIFFSLLLYQLITKKQCLQARKKNNTLGGNYITEKTNLYVNVLFPV